MVVPHRASSPAPRLATILVCWIASACAGDDHAPHAARVGARAEAKLVMVNLPSVPPEADNPQSLGGTASFVETAAGVDFALTIKGCYHLMPYPLRILEATDCAELPARPRSWDGARGEELREIRCFGATGAGLGFDARKRDAANAWTVGGPLASNVVGHALAMYDPDDPQRVLACGVIELVRDAPVDAGTSSLSNVPLALQAQLMGSCFVKEVVRGTSEPCPKLDELVACGNDHCALTECVDSCRDYLACLQTDEEPCTSGCEVDEACAACQGEVTACSFRGFCAEHFVCAAPITPGGPCEALEACSMLQGDRAESVLEGVRAIERLAGDPGCVAAVHDWDFVTHAIHDPPCTFDF